MWSTQKFIVSISPKKSEKQFNGKQEHASTFCYQISFDKLAHEPMQERYILNWPVEFNLCARHTV